MYNQKKLNSNNVSFLGGDWAYGSKGIHLMQLRTDHGSPLCYHSVCDEVLAHSIDIPSDVLYKAYRPLNYCNSLIKGHTLGPSSIV